MGEIGDLALEDAALMARHDEAPGAVPQLLLVVGEAEIGCLLAAGRGRQEAGFGRDELRPDSGARAAEIALCRGAGGKDEPR